MDQVSETVGPAPLAQEVRPGENFVVFFENEYRRLAKAMYILTGNAQEADDLAQEALVRVYERWDRVRRMESPVGYLYRIACNLHRSRMRRRAMLARRSLYLENPVGPDPLLAVEDRDELGRLLAALPRTQREIVVLLEWLGFDAVQGSRVLGISPAAARMRLSRARAFLREHVGGSDG